MGELNNTSNSHANTEKRFDNVNEKNNVEEKEKLFKKNVNRFNIGQVGGIDFQSVESNLNVTSQSVANNESSMDNRSRTKSVGKKASKPPKRKKMVHGGVVKSKLQTGTAEVITTVKQKSNFNAKKPKINIHDKQYSDIDERSRDR